MKKHIIYMIIMLSAPMYPQFGPQQIISNQDSTPRYAVAAEINNDGAIDVIAAIDGLDSNLWYENIANSGNFTKGEITNNLAIQDLRFVTTADIDADNGVVHVVDKVIAVPTVVDLAVQGDFSVLVAALTRSDLTANFVEILSGTGPFTVFAPTDQAFLDLLASNAAWTTLEDIPVATLEAVLKYHVVAGANVLSSTLEDNQMVTTFEGSDFTINTTSGVTITDGQGGVSTIVATDVR